MIDGWYSIGLSEWWDRQSSYNLRTALTPGTKCNKATREIGNTQISAIMAQKAKVLHQFSFSTFYTIKEKLQKHETLSYKLTTKTSIGKTMNNTSRVILL